MSVNLSSDLLKQYSASGAKAASAEPKELEVNTTRFSGCNLQKFKTMVQEGLNGKDKEFFERIQKRGVDNIFRTFDGDANGTLSKSEAQDISSIGFNQTKKNSGVLSGDSGLAALLAKMGSVDLSKISLGSAFSGGSSTGAAMGVGGGATGSINFAMQFNGKSQSEMAGPMSATGFHAGAWCADFVYFALKNANVVPPGYDSINHAYCPAIANWARQTGRAFSDPSQAKPGDLMIMNDEGHIGIVTGVDASGIHTVEGNTSGSGGGSCVSTKVRDFGALSTFVRI